MTDALLIIGFLLLIGGGLFLGFFRKKKRREARIEDPLPRPSNPMDPAAWDIGPFLDGKSRSVGMPRQPFAHPEGWQFAFPYPDQANGHVHYVTVPFYGSLAEYERIRMRFRIEAEPGTRFPTVDYPGQDGYITGYIQRAGDDWTAKGKFNFYRWFAGFAFRKVGVGEHEMIIPLHGPWGAAVSGNAISRPNEFREALENAGRIGFVMGGGDGYGHGLYATGRARFIMLEFAVE